MLSGRVTDITSLDVDAIVNVANEELGGNRGLSRVGRRRFHAYSAFIEAVF